MHYTQTNLDRFQAYLGNEQGIRVDFSREEDVSIDVVVAVCVVCALVVTALFIVLLVLCCKRYRAEKHEQKLDYEEHVTNHLKKRSNPLPPPIVGLTPDLVQSTHSSAGVVNYGFEMSQFPPHQQIPIKRSRSFTDSDRRDEEPEPARHPVGMSLTDLAGRSDNVMTPNSFHTAVSDPRLYTSSLCRQPRSMERTQRGQQPHSLDRTHYSPDRTPHSLDRAHGGHERVPGTLDRVPGSLERVHGHIDRGPGSLERVHDRIDRGLGSLERCPGSLERTPRSCDRIPGTFERPHGPVNHDYDPNDILPPDAEYTYPESYNSNTRPTTLPRQPRDTQLPSTRGQTSPNTARSTGGYNSTGYQLAKAQTNHDVPTDDLSPEAFSPNSRRKVFYEVVV